MKPHINLGKFGKNQVLKNSPLKGVHKNQYFQLNF